ncbi:hypothetical protein [Streptomyces sp. IB2014 016-6]|uniref:hypothetical protein n=1 Tax=Streptomyces sp. IB2014 016-6 TaxID=2517818 RepID=UPI0011C86664|nr:hypothetical protein [Streptomyces sp. IB2014 016-6]TXL90353.1 hypothetical protein EW053_10965 [Streptomyces sp. IB2014 016-6]
MMSVRTRFTEDDFGITHLASMFHQDWRRSGNARDLVVRYVAEVSEPYVLALAVDARRLAASDAADVVAAVWECATGPYYSLRRESKNGLEWMREILGICEIALDRTGPHSEDVVDGSPYFDLMGRVVGEIDAVGLALSEAVSVDSPTATASALRACAVDISPELAFRVLLRGLMEYSIEIDRDDYLRFEELGKRFSYGEFVVARISFLVR